MTQWTPDQPGYNPDFPPTPILGGLGGDPDQDISDFMIAQALSLVGTERRRQIDVEGWTRTKDATRDPADWCQLIQDRIDLVRSLEFSPGDGLSDSDKEDRQNRYFKAMVQIAALSCAAIESMG